jgi:hypothetical protein
MWISRSSIARSSVVLLIIAVVIAVIQPLFQRVYWVGFTDLEITINVTDARTDQPIQGATIHVESGGGFCDHGEKSSFRLVVDEAGDASKMCASCMCFGTSGWNIDTHVVHLPDWRYRVSAEGYKDIDYTSLDIPENVRNVRRGKPAATLLVLVQMEQKPSLTKR